jgi:hypothetical protein
MSASLYIFIMAILANDSKYGNLLAVMWFISLFIDFK